MPRKPKGTPRGALKTEGKPLFVRVSQKEREIVEYACKLKHGAVDGYLSSYSRRALIAYSKAIIARKQKEKEKEVED